MPLVVILKDRSGLATDDLILSEMLWIPGSAQEIHDEYTGADVLLDLDGDVHPVLADMARGHLPRAPHEGQHLLPNRGQRLEEHTGN